MPSKRLYANDDLKRIFTGLVVLWLDFYNGNNIIYTVNLIIGLFRVGIRRACFLNRPELFIYTMLLNILIETVVDSGYSTSWHCIVLQSINVTADNFPTGKGQVKKLSNLNKALVKLRDLRSPQ